MFSRISLSVLLLTAAVAPQSHAQVPWRPQGEELQVNVQTFRDQFRPAVASDAAGNVLVVWLDSELRVFGRLYAPSGHPLSGEFRIGQPEVSNFDTFHRPRVTATANGIFLVAWTSILSGINLRHCDASGPLGAMIKIYDEPGEFVGEPDLVSLGAGDFLVTWPTTPTGLQYMVLAQRIDSQGRPLSGVFTVSPPLAGPKSSPRVAADPASGDFVVAWTDERESDNPDIWARRFTRVGNPLGSEFLVNSEKDGEQFGAVPIFPPGGGFSIVWAGLFPDRLEIVAQRFGTLGDRSGSAVVLSGEGADITPPAVVATPSGKLLVLWAGPDRRSDDTAVLAQVFDRSWRPASGIFEVNTFTQWDQTEPAVTVDASGNFFAVWSSGERQFPQTPQPVDYEGQDGSSYGVFGQRFTLAEGCVPEATRLCLNQNRFQVEATWRKPSGETGVGHAVPLTGDTGALWFFGAENLELLIKVLDARAVNGHFWVYAGALSNVEYTIKVTDTSTGEERSYRNPPGQFASRADTEAFRDDAPASAVAAKAPAAAVPQTAPLSPAIPCSPSPQSLCFMEGQFEITVEFTDPRTGLKGQARSVPLTADTGAFWFFDSANLELMIKVLDARPVNGRFWVFFGALSDVDYTITVTDRVHGGQKVYRNRQGDLASRADVEAF